MQMNGRCTVLVLLAALILGGVASPSRGQSTPLEVPLTLHKIRTAGEAWDLGASGSGAVWPTLISGKPDRGTLGLQVVGTPRLFRIKLEGLDHSVIAVLGKSTKSAITEDRLWLDWSGGAEQRSGPLVGKPMRDGTLFGPLHSPRSGAATSEFWLLVTRYEGCRILAAEYREGVVTLSGQKVRLGILATINGSRECLLVDENGDGKFTGTHASSVSGWDHEIVPFDRLVQMPDGNFYRVRTTSAGDGLLLERDVRPTGRVRFDGGRMSMLLEDRGRMLLVKGSDGALTCPVGRYRIWSIALFEESGPGRYWTATITPSPENGMLEVSAGMTTAVRCGPPFEISVRKRQDYAKIIALNYDQTVAHDIPEPDPRDIAFDLSLRDRAGNVVNNVTTPAGKRPPEPALKVWDKQGRILKRDRFHYG
jgi:hypothetical protein